MMLKKTFKLKNFSQNDLISLCEESKSPISTQGSQINFEEQEGSFSNLQGFGTSFKSFSQSLHEEQVRNIQHQVFQWFSSKNITSGNPEEIVEKYNEQQKKQVISRVQNQKTKRISSASCIDDVQVAKNSLLLRRARRSSISH